MIQLIKSRLYPEKLDVLYDRPLSAESIAEDFEIKGGKWFVNEEGWLVGENRENSAAMIISKSEYFADVLVEFDAATVLPATRDINFSWHMGWDDEKNQRGTAYVVGLEGWWQGMVGFEKSPDYTFYCNTKLLNFVPGKEYHIAVGNIGNDVFICVNGTVALEIHDPDPIDINRFGRIGFEAYCTKVKYKNLVVRKAVAEECYKPYDPEF